MSSDRERSTALDWVRSLHPGQQLALVVVAGYLLVLVASAATAAPGDGPAG